MTNINAPKIRFEGFTDAWEQRKLNEVLKVNSGRDYKHLNSGDIPVYGTGGYMLSVDDKLSDVDGIGIGRKGTIDRPQYLKAPYWTVDTLFYMTAIKENNLRFLFSLSQRVNWKRMDESTGVPSLSKAVIEKVNISIPTIEEQEKIGAFFKSLDDTIALQKRKLVLLKEQKKGFLQKMFPKAGEKFPELRFEGFTDGWEQRKLKDMIEKVIDNRGKTPPVKSEGEYPMIEVASLGGFYPDYSKVIKYVDRETFENWFRSYLNEGDILFSTVGNTGLTSLMNDNSNAVIAQNIIGMRFTKEYSPLFVNQLFKNLDNIKKVKRIEMGAVQPSVKVSQLIHLKYHSPSLEEQKKIGAFFKSLDDTIALQESKLEKLKEVKKGFLQKIFV